MFAVREEFGARTRKILKDRADLMCECVTDYSSSLEVNEIDLGSNGHLFDDCAAAHSMGKTYAVDALPDEAQLRTDLQTAVRVYRALIYRGGFKGSTQLENEPEIFL